jgi:hypothetical protein
MHGCTDARMQKEGKRKKAQRKSAVHSCIPASLHSCIDEVSYFIEIPAPIIRRVVRGLLGYCGIGVLGLIA